MGEKTLIDTTHIISSVNPIFYHLLESYRLDDSNMWSNIGFTEEIGNIEMKIYTLSGTLPQLNFDSSYDTAVNV